MTREVTLPLWLFLPLAATSLAFVLLYLVLPLVQRLLRRRSGRVLDELEPRLRIKIQPFKLTRRRVLIERLRDDPAVVAAADAYARENGERLELALARAERYAREIVPSFNAYFYFRIGYWLAQRAVESLYRVRLGWFDARALLTVPRDATVVFVINHRSNVDYLLVAYLVAKKTALSYAVGEWARIWPLQPLIRSMGAYFVRRGSRNALYRRVLERYVQMATAGGLAQAVFPEGRLSRDGALGEGKTGLIDYMLRGFDPAGDRDLVFVPVGVNYDRTLEDRTLLLDVEPERDPRPALRTSVGFALQQLGLMLRGRWYRFGYACVNLGAPISMKARHAERGVDYRTLDPDERYARVRELTDELLDQIGRVIPVLPVALVSSVLLEIRDRALSELEIKGEVQRLIASLERGGARVYVPRADRDYATGVGLRMLTLRRLVAEQNGLFRAREQELPALRYYANAIRHLKGEPLEASRGPEWNRSARSTVILE